MEKRVSVSLHGRSLFAEQLEPRILFSGAPFPSETTAPDEILSSDEALASGTLGEVIFEDSHSPNVIDSFQSQRVRLADADWVSRLAEAAAKRWEETGISDAQAAALEGIEYRIGDLNGFLMASYEEGIITIDRDASGVGWFLDATPLDDAEFGNHLSSGALGATQAGAAQGVDLLSVLLHEQGHAIGLEDVYDPSETGNLMYGGVQLGERRLPALGQAEGAVPGSVDGVAHAAVTADQFLDVVNGDTSSIANLLVDNGGDGISLREAILASNNTAGPNTITLLNGVYLMQIDDNGNEDGRATAPVIDATAQAAVLAATGVLPDIDPTEDNGTDENSGDSGDFDVRNSVTIAGAGEALTAIDAQHLDRVFHILNDASVTFEDLTIQGGRINYDHGAGFVAENGTRVVLNNVTLTGNVAKTELDDQDLNGEQDSDRHGGGFWADGAEISGTGVSILNNSAERGDGSADEQDGRNAVGGGFWLTGDATVDFTDVVIDGNTARQGAGFFVSNGDFGGSTVKLTNATIANNTSVGRGGGFHNSSVQATVTIDGGTIESNSTLEDHGGGFFNAGTVELTGVDILNNQARDDDGNLGDSDGGGFYNDPHAGDVYVSGVVRMNGGSIVGNTAFGDGGGFYNRGGLVEILGTVLDRVAIDGNKAGGADGAAAAKNGGGFYVSDFGTATLENVDFNSTGTDANAVSLNGSAEVDGNGAGFFNNGSFVNLTNVTIQGHQGDEGAAFFQSGVRSETHGTNVSLTGNTARTRGGAFRNSSANGLVELTDSVIDGNTAQNEHGGGIHSGGKVVLDNTVVSNNQALDLDGSNRRDSVGGGIYNTGGTLDLRNGSNVVGNSVFGEGAGIRNDNGFLMADGITIDGNFNIFNNSGRDGAGIYNSGGRVELNDVVITNNSTGTDGGGDLQGEGGGIYQRASGTILITGNSRIAGNEASEGGGVYNTNNHSSLTIEGTSGERIEIENNTARSHGGGIRSTGDTTLNLSFVDVLGNTSLGGQGGGLDVDGAAFAASDLNMVGNSSGAQGGGLSLTGNGRATVTDIVIRNNSADSDGGGIFSDNNLATFDNLTLEDNFSGDDGGGLALFNSARFTLKNGSISGNTAADQGGGARMEDDSELTISNFAVVDNLAGYQADRVTVNNGNSDGGGFSVVERARLNASDSAIDTNEATDRGGGIYAEDQATIEVNGSSISENAAGDFGGGLYFQEQTLGNVINSTISGNVTGYRRAEHGGVVDFTATPTTNANSDGGGIYAQNESILKLNHVTVAANAAADDGAGIDRNNSAEIFIENSIVFGNRRQVDTDVDLFEDTNAQMTLIGANVIGVHSGSALVGDTGNLITTDPNLGALADNGGPTRTHAIDAASVASGAAIDSRLAVDQRGQGRPAANRDLGAFEADPVAETLVLDSFEAPENALSGEAADFSASATSTGAGPLSFDWVVRDGSGAVFTTGTGEDFSPVLTVGAADPVQLFEVELTVTDTTTGQTVRETREIRVIDPVAAPTAAAGTIEVDTALDVVDGADGLTSLREAIDAANASGAGNFVITFNAALNGTNVDLGIAPNDSGDNENNNARGDFDITKTNGVVSIVGNGVAQTVIDGNQVDRVFHVRPGAAVYFSDLTITGGESTTSDRDGGGLLNDGGISILRNVDVVGNAAAESDNDADGGGIQVLSNGRNPGLLGMIGGRVANNAADRDGGGIHMEGSNVGESVLFLAGMEISGNQSSVGTSTDRDGGGFYITGAGNRVIFQNVTVADNIAAGDDRADGGGGYFTGADHIVEISGGSFVRNQAGNDPDADGSNDADGGGFIIQGTRQSITLNGVMIGGELTGGIGSARGDGNVAEDEGGGFFMEGRFNVLTLIDTSIVGNQSNDGGGGFFVSNATETVNFVQTQADGVQIRSNFAVTDHAGGFRNQGTVTITGSATDPVEIVSNEARESGDRAGGFYNSGGGKVLLTDVRIEDNVAGANGGGFWNDGGSTVTIESSAPGTFRSTISNNQATSGDGGGFYNGSAFSLVKLTDVLISGNSAGDEGAGFLSNNNFNQTRLTNVDIVNNIAEDNGGGFRSASNGSEVFLTNVLIDGNRSETENGGGFHNSGLLEGQSVTITNNFAGGLAGTDDRRGGGFYNNGGRVTLTDVTIDTNESSRHGGGFWNDNQGVVSISSSNPGSFLSSISGNTLRGGGGDGGGFYSTTSGSLVTLTDVEIRNNVADDEGGGFRLSSDNSFVELTNVVIDNNTADDLGGGFYNASSYSRVTLNNVKITNNVSLSDNGGGFRTNGQVTGQEVIIEANRTEGSGNENNEGAGFIVSGDSALVDFTHVEITNNASYGRGGGFFSDGSSQVFLDDFLIEGNSTAANNENRGRGGGFWSSGNSDITLSNGSISNNKSFGHGGGFFAQDDGVSVTMTSVNMVANTAGFDTVAGAAVNNRDGGGLFFNDSEGRMVLTDVLISANVASRHAGGIRNTGQITGTRVRITDNVSGDVGGGIYTNGSGADVRIDQFDISGNVAGGRGGGVFNQSGSGITLTSGTISNNIAAQRGGGLYQESGGSTTVLTNVTVSGNRAGRNSDGTVSNANEDGGGLYNNSGGSEMILTHVTVTNNDATRNGGGLDRDNGTVTIRNSIFAGNQRNSDTTPEAGDTSGNITLEEANLIEVIQGGTVSGNSGGLIQVDPLLGVLQDNGGTILPGGGAAFTHLPGDPANEAATNSALAEDQRGVARPQEATADLGAVEFRVIALVDDTGTVNEDAGSTFVDLTGNDTPGEGGALVVDSVNVPGTVDGTVVIDGTGTGVDFDPNGQYESLAEGETRVETFTYAVQGSGDAAQAQVTVQGANDAPAIDAGGSQGNLVQNSAADGFTVNLNNIVVFSDLDLSDSHTVTVNWGDSSPVDTLTVDLDAAGQANFGNPATASTANEFSADGSHTFGANGDFTVTVTINDGNTGGSVQHQFEVSLQDLGAAGPVAVSDDYRGSNPITEDQTLTIPDGGNDLLANDSNAAAVLTPVVTSANGATVTIAQDGSFTYDPTGAPALQDLDEGQSLTDTFTYTITDAAEFPDGLFQVQVVNTSGSNPGTSTDNWLNLWNALDGGAGPTGDVAGFNVVNNTTDTETVFDYVGGGDFGVNNAIGTIAGDGPGGGAGPFNPGGTSGGNYSIRATTFLKFTTGGTFSIAMGSDDGRRIELTEAFAGSAAGYTGFTARGDQVNGSFAAGDTVVGFSGGTGHNQSVGVFTVGDGDILALDAFYYEGGGGDSGEISIASGSVTTFNSTAFTLLQNGVLGIQMDSDAATSFDVETSTATVSVRVNGVNDPVQAAGETFITDEATPVTGENVLANDTDADNDPADVPGVKPAGDDDDPKNVIRVNGDSASVGAPITLPSGALLTMNADGSFVYDPNGAFDGLGATERVTDSFTYTVDDNRGDGTDVSTDTATVTIEINGLNNAPVAASDNFGAGENGSASGNVTGNDSDTDSNNVIFVSGADTSGLEGSLVFDLANQGDGGLSGTFFDLNDNLPGSENDIQMSARPWLLEAPQAGELFVLQSLARLGMEPTVAGAITGAIDFPSTTGDVFPGVADALDNDHIAAIFEGKIEIATGGTYTFGLNSDDGSVLYINGQKILDRNQFGGFSNSPTSGSVDLIAGQHDIVIGFFEGNGGGGIEFSYSGPDTADASEIVPAGVLFNDVDAPGTFVPGGLSGTFFDTNNNNVNGVNNSGVFAGNVGPYLLFDIPAGSQILLEALPSQSEDSDIFVPFIDFGSGTEESTGTGTVLDRGSTNGTIFGGLLQAAGGSVDNDHTAALFRGFLKVTVAGDYTFTARPDDGVVVNIDGQTVVSRIGTGGMTNLTSGPVTLSEGFHEILIGHFEGTGGAGLQVSFEGPGTNGREILGPQFLSTVNPAGGDGSFTYDPNGQFEFLAAGETATDTFSYTISDHAGQTDTATVTVTVTGTNDPIVLTGTAGNRILEKGVEFTLTDILSFTDLDLGDIHNFTIDWDDGSPVDNGIATLDVAGSANLGGAAVSTPNQKSFDGTHTYTATGDFTVTVTVTDNNGGTGQHQFLISSVLFEPELNLDQPADIEIGETVTFTGNYVDFGGIETQTLVVHFNDNASVQPPAFRIDATFEIPAAVDLTAGQRIFSTTDNSVLVITDVDAAAGRVEFSLDHTYVTDGIREVDFVITDEAGGSDRVDDLRTVVFFQAPENGAPGIFTNEPDEPGTISLFGFDTISEVIQPDQLLFGQTEGNQEMGPRLQPFIAGVAGPGEGIAITLRDSSGSAVSQMSTMTNEMGQYAMLLDTSFLDPDETYTIEVSVTLWESFVRPRVFSVSLPGGLLGLDDTLHALEDEGDIMAWILGNEGIVTDR